MKKLSVLVILFLTAVALKATNETNSYVTVGDKTYFCQDVKPGLLNLNLIMDDGTTLRVPYKKVSSYTSNGHMYERLPVVCKDAPANCTALMEYVKSRNGFRLYKYCKTQAHGELCDNTYEKAHAEYMYFVYKNGKFYLPVTQDNVESVLPFFGVKVISWVK